MDAKSTNPVKAEKNHTHINSFFRLRALNLAPTDRKFENTIMLRHSELSIEALWVPQCVFSVCVKHYKLL